MSTSHRVVVFAPRLLGLAMAGFLTLLSFDSLTPRLPLPWAIAFMVMHLAPALAVLLLVAIGWHWPFAGAIGFFAVAVLYVFLAPRLRLDWIAAISGPLTIVGAAFLWTWLRQPTLAEDA